MDESSLIHATVLYTEVGFFLADHRMKLLRAHIECGDCKKAPAGVILLESLERVGAI